MVSVRKRLSFLGETSDAQPAHRSPAGPESLRKLLCWAFIGVTILFFAASIRASGEQGHHRMMWSFGNFTYSLAALSTDWNYGVGRYVYYSSPRSDSASTKTKEAGLTWDFDYKDNQQRIEAAMGRLFLDETVTLPPETTGPPYKDLMGVGWGMDIGFIDFLDLSFSLFGISLSSIFLTVYLLLGLSLAIFIGAFARDPVALAVVALYTIAFYIFVSSPAAMERSLYWTVTNPKFLSFLCIVPLLHAGFMVLNGDRISPLNLLLLVAQLALLFFAIHNRSTTAWAALSIILLAVCRFIFDESDHPWWRSLGKAWVGFTAVAVVALGQMLVISATHPAMAASGQEPRHTFWVSAYCALTYHEDWAIKYAAAHENRGCEDAAVKAATSYMARHAEQDFSQVYRAPGIFRHDEMDQIVKKAYFELAQNDPQFIVDFFLFSSPERLWLMMHNLLIARIMATPPLTGLAVAFVLGLALVGYLVIDSAARRRFHTLVVAAPLVLLVSLSPSWLVLGMWDSLLDPCLLTILLAFLAATTTALWATMTLKWGGSRVFRMVNR